jgi:hypothetical protein
VRLPEWNSLQGYRKDCIDLPLISGQLPVVPSRRLDIRIRELCARAISADDTNFAQILSELRAALHQHAAQMREMAAQQISARKSYQLRNPEEEPCNPTPTLTSD